MSDGINFFCKYGLYLPEMCLYVRALFINTTFQCDNLLRNVSRVDTHVKPSLKNTYSDLRIKVYGMVNVEAQRNFTKVFSDVKPAWCLLDQKWIFLTGLG